MNSIMIKTTGNYFAVYYYVQNEVPFLSWCYQISTIVQDLIMMKFCSSDESMPPTRFYGRVVAHFLVIAVVCYSTPAVLYGLLFKTCLSLLFKIKVVFGILETRNVSNISHSTYALSIVGNLLILSLNFLQKRLFQMYLNAAVNIFLDLTILVLVTLLRKHKVQ